MNDYFQFRQFRVGHRRSSMKVGTDAVLLGAWVDLTRIHSILDVGTGTGILALMLAQRTGGKVKIEAIEIDNQAAMDAAENFSVSPWAGVFQLHTLRVQQFQPKQKYDLIISNPPYFINSLKPPDASRKTVRHNDAMTFDDLLVLAANHLNRPSGRLALILPVAESDIFSRKASVHGLYLFRQCNFRTRMHKPIERKLMEFSFLNSSLQTTELCLYENGDVWTQAYQQLTGQFYLKG